MAIELRRGTKPDLDRLMGPEAARSAEMEAVWTWLVEQDGGAPNWLDLPPAEGRRVHDGLSAKWNSLLPKVQSVETIVVPGSPPVSCQLVTPEDAEPGCILFLHGGGFSFGNLQTHARFIRLVAHSTRRAVLAVDYRLAPENPFPAPFEDCRTAWQWLAGAGRGLARGGMLAIGGDSAGASLSMSVMLDAIDHQASLPDLALLFYGAYSEDLDSRSYRRFAEGFGLSRAGMSRYWDFYVPDKAARKSPLLAAVHASDADLRQLPPLYLNAASLDPLLSDTFAFLRRLDSAGADYECVVHEGVHHGFMQMSLRLPEAQRAIDRAAAFVRAHAR